MDSGLDKLVEAGESVTLLKAELAIKEAELIIANQKADKVIIIILIKHQQSLFFHLKHYVFIRY